jgi:hypothetical protein
MNVFIYSSYLTRNRKAYYLIYQGKLNLFCLKTQNPVINFIFAQHK